ncbi:MAG: MbcA/ParS/Xre antitoxin family protein [Bacteroidota bacterium]
MMGSELKKLHEYGKEVLGEGYEEWLARENPALGRTPKVIIDSIEGIRTVEKLLGRIDHGIFS